MPSPGHFVLHSRMVPPLGAGDYVLHGTQQVAGGLTAPYDGNVRVTSPRYRMPPDQIMSAYPPANAEGAFESRLPQIVIRRRTLPWERIVDADRRVPWLALVVIAEGEGTLSPEVPIADCVTPGTSLAGPNDVATGIYLNVPQTTVDKVFPTRDDLPLLVHVREVDLNDTELAMGDDDGFLAVILANRLPQYDRQNCKPVRYLACLINLEGQLGALPPPSVNDADTFLATDAVIDLGVLAAMQGGPVLPDTLIMGSGIPPRVGGAGGLVHGQARAERRGLPPGPLGANPAATASNAIGSHPSSRAAGWAYTPKQIEQAAISAAPEDAWRVARDVMGAGWRYNVDALVREPRYRFPVLSYWSFTCTGAGSFETLMQGLDVALLGSTPINPSQRPQPDCVPAAKGSKPPPAPTPRPDLEVAETGHVGLDYLTRRGENVRSWYRGPLTLHVTQRDVPEPGGRLALAHTSDQLRRLVPDGREDLSYAAAFEIGRLLALSQPSVVASLMRWRAERFGEARASRLSGLALDGIAGIGVKGTLEDLGRLVGKQFLLEAAKNRDGVLGPRRPLADPGRPIEYLRGDLDQIIATGFGLDLARVRELSSNFGTLGALASLPVPQGAAERFDAAAAEGLKAGLAAAVNGVVADALKLGNSPGPGGKKPRASARRDALDDLLADAVAAAEDTE
jgi:hypothetical protein